MATIISEFSAGSDGRKFNGTCTQASAAMAMTMADPSRNQSYQSVVNLMIAMRDDMAARGWLSAPNGSSTISAMADELYAQGATLDLVVRYGNGAMSYDWISYLRANAGTNPIVLQLLNTSALASVNDWNANVSCHAIAILGKQENGYICGDPNRPAGSSQFLIYSYQLLQKAVPCGMIGLRSKVSVVTVGGSKLLDLPSGWSSRGSGDALEWVGPASPVDNQQFSISHGILYFLRTGNNWRGGVPLEPIHKDQDGIYRQAWDIGVVEWRDQSGGSWANAGLYWLQQRNQIADLQNQIATLQSQLTQVKPLDPKAQAALTAIEKMKEAINA
jgi:hypothetical protein